MSHGNQTQSPIDPQAPFIASDGLEYEDLAACILGRPLGCPRNEHILAHRRAGRSEEAIRVWIKAYDGEDPTPSSVLEAAAKARHEGRALHRAQSAWNSAIRGGSTTFTGLPYQF